MLTQIWSSKECLSVIMLPDTLNWHLEGLLITQMQRYFLADTDNLGNKAENPLHHIN